MPVRRNTLTCDDAGRSIRGQPMDARGDEEQSVLPIYRAEYLHAIEMARATHNPCDDWEGFVEELWSGLVSAFGLDVAVLKATEHEQRLDGLKGPLE